jgi:hypothetical protein
MSELHDFLVEHAKFPFPHPTEDRSANTADVSVFEVGVLEREWKAKHAVRDDTLVQKLCHSLKNILSDSLLEAGAEKYLLASFSPQLQFDERGATSPEWSRNPNKAQVSFSDLHSTWRNSG